MLHSGVFGTAVIHVEKLTKRYGDRVLLEDVDWHVKKRDRIGLSGPNGSGKTTILRMLAGLEEPDSGSIRMASETTIGYLPQDGIVHAGRTVHEEVSLAFEPLLALKAEQHSIEDQLAHAQDGDGGEHEKLLERYADVTERFKQLGGYEIDARIADVLRGLGFQPGDVERRTEEFSGGWQMRIALAKLLLARPNLLLMDEPTNHLDLPARNWLEEYVAAYPGSVVLVAHDRYFLDATVKRITQVGLKTLTDYHGNYSRYLVEHEARMERLTESARRQQEEVDKAEAFINKFRYKATKARQVQSRIKQLEKVERIEVPPQRKRIRFKFPAAPRPGRIVMQLEAVARGYGGQPVLSDVDLIVERGDRIALVGANGAGKTTLMRLLAGELPPEAGSRTLGHQVVMEYFAQDQAGELTGSHTVHDEMTSHSPLAMIPRVRSILGGFLFSGDDVMKPVQVLSGGERNRLALAKMLLRPSNLLLLDEPTNHLDIESKEVLLEALADYEGTIVFVSHDRYFVDRLSGKVVEIASGAAFVYPGGYEDFLDWKRRRASGDDAPLPLQRNSKGPPPSDPEKRGGASGTRKPKRQRTRPEVPGEGSGAGAPPATLASPADPLAPRLRPKGIGPDRQVQEREARRARQRIAELEQRISAKETAVKELEARMAAPGFYDDRARAEAAALEHRALSEEVGALLQQWEELQASVEG
jgi:ATP-binding cassette subfamily F protein 3